MSELKATQAKAKEERCEEESQTQQQQIHELITAVRKFGRWPREHAATEDPKLEEERKLAHDMRKALDTARPPPAFVSELEAMKARAEEETIDEEKRRWEIRAQELMADVEVWAMATEKERCGACRGKRACQTRTQCFQFR